MCSVIIPATLKTIVRDRRRAVKETWHVCRAHGLELMLLLHAGYYMHPQMVFKT